MGVVTCLLPFLVSPTHLRSIGHNAGEAWVIYAAALLLVCAATLLDWWAGRLGYSALALPRWS